MQTQTQHGVAGLLAGLWFRSSPLGRLRPAGRPVWMRMLAIVCLLLVVAMSTIQVCHVHGEAAAKQGSRQGDPTPENHCPLCVAMHSAVPTGIHVAPEPLAAVRALDSVAADAERMFRWRFEMASRPPPPAAAFA